MASKNRPGDIAAAMANAPAATVPTVEPTTIESATLETEVRNDATYEPLSRMFPFFGPVAWVTDVQETPTEFKEGKQKGTVQTGLANGLIESLDYDGNPSGMLIPVRVVAQKDASGKTAFLLNWPKSGSGVYSRPIFIVKNSPDAAKELDRLSAHYLADWQRFRRDELSRVGKVVKSAPKPKPAAVQMSAEEIAALGFEL